MNTTNILISVGFGVGAIIAIAVYRFLRKKKALGYGTSNFALSNEDVYEKVDIISYDMVLAWVKNNNNKIGIVGGDRLFILQDPVARDAFKNTFPQEFSSIRKSSILCTGIIRNKEIIASKFFVYEIMAKSFKEMLPKDSKKSYIQIIED